jgi:dienelactone hydrolase
MLEQLVHIPADHVSLEGMLELPEGAPGIVLFAHGSGSSRHSPRNNYVARVLRDAGLGTLLIDLLTREEDMDYETRFDIPLLTRRLLAATRWLQDDERTRSLAIGYFGASTGAAAALQAAAAMGGRIAAVVSRGGRPDLAGTDSLSRVRCPTLLIVGGYDDVVIELNRQAHEVLACEKELLIVPGATHLFEEPGTLEQVAEQAAQWFSLHLKST